MCLDHMSNKKLVNEDCVSLIYLINIKDSWQGSDSYNSSLAEGHAGRTDYNLSICVI